MIRSSGCPSFGTAGSGANAVGIRHRVWSCVGLANPQPLQLLLLLGKKKKKRKHQQKRRQQIVEQMQRSTSKPDCIRRQSRIKTVDPVCRNRWIACLKSTKMPLSLSRKVLHSSKFLSTPPNPKPEHDFHSLIKLNPKPQILNPKISLHYRKLCLERFDAKIISGVFSWVPFAQAQGHFAKCEACQ